MTPFERRLLIQLTNAVLEQEFRYKAERGDKYIEPTSTKKLIDGLDDFITYMSESELEGVINPNG